MQKYIRKETANKGLPEFVEAEQWVEYSRNQMGDYLDVRKFRGSPDNICYKCGHLLSSHGWDNKINFAENELQNYSVNNIVE